MAQKIIVLDGPDGCGKTEIARGLHAVMGIPYYRFDRQHEFFRSGDRFMMSLVYGDTLLADFLAKTGHSAIFDRSYPSEWVYSRVYGRETSLDALRDIDVKFRSMGACIIIPVRSDYSRSRADEVIDRSMLRTIHDTYREFSSWAVCDTMFLYVDALDDDLATEIDEIRVRAPRLFD